ncbi:MAG: carboxymuconolactone decarboxylase family protein [Candidatus Binatus sp.]|uniref:carboxymuconolactone decarboxylase family protein n=1 Tax=Candidatus Binatus sp. TaxID=2811406 RepID=UPI002727D66B|nr:carboxymuconolactone decarboxylase family protein [Candidatus Binatus sp.]MDO8433016.1 carboxymuconolactone decarboxylase family protein [Candidatus Binatus sp.]
MPSKSTPEAWVKLPDPEQMGAARGDDHPYNFGYIPAMGRLIAAHPRIGPAFGMMFATVMFAPGALTRAERELVAAVAASAQDCHY